MRPNNLMAPLFLISLLCWPTLSLAQSEAETPLDEDAGEDWLSGSTAFDDRAEVLGFSAKFEERHFEVQVELSHPVMAGQYVRGRGFGHPEYVELELPFARLIEEPIEYSAEPFPGYSRITIEPFEDTLSGVVVKFWFDTPRSFPDVRINLDYQTGQTITMTSAREYDQQRRLREHWDGWVTLRGRKEPESTGPVNPFARYELYTIEQVEVSGREVRVVTSLDELDVHHQQDNAISWDGQFELRHQIRNGRVLYLQERDPVTGYVYYRPNHWPDIADKGPGRLTVLLRRGATLAERRMEPLESKREEQFLGEVQIVDPGDAYRMATQDEIAIWIELPQGVFDYTFWVEGGTLVIRASDPLPVD